MRLLGEPFGRKCNKDDNSRMLSQSVQDYLKTIYALHQHGERTTTNDLAEKLDVAPASVSGMIKKLSELKLVDHEPYQGVRLTPAGEKMALAIIRHHRLIELYLTEAMGYTWDRVHEEADRLEHAISEEFADKISTLLGDPKVDPHGDPIPTKEGTVASTSASLLKDVSAGHTVRVERVRDEDPALLRLFAELGLLPKSQVFVESVSADGATWQVRIAGRIAQQIGREVAYNVYVVDAA